MFNQIILIGKIVELPDDASDPLVIEVLDNFKNREGALRLTTFKSMLWKGLLDTLRSSHQVGDVIVLKGRLIVMDDKYQIITESLLPVNHYFEKPN